MICPNPRCRKHVPDTDIYCAYCAWSLHGLVLYTIQKPDRVHWAVRMAPWVVLFIGATIVVEFLLARGGY